DSEKKEGAVKIGRQDRRSSAISAANAETILVRGRDLARELIGTLSFSEHFWLLLTAALPSAAQRRVLDATLVAIAEHGMVPSVQAARMTLAAGPEALQGAVAAGLLGCGSVVLGSSADAGMLFAGIAGRVAGAGGAEPAARPLGRAEQPRRGGGGASKAAAEVSDAAGPGAPGLDRRGGED